MRNENMYKYLLLILPLYYVRVRKLISYRKGRREEVFLIPCGGARLTPLGTSAPFGLLYQSRLIDDDECEGVGGMRTGRETEVQGQTATVPHRPSQIPHKPTWDQTLAAVVGSRQLTAWVLSRGGSYICWPVPGSALHGDRCNAGCDAHTNSADESACRMPVTFGIKGSY
jgi:hypothetical protein